MFKALRGDLQMIEEQKLLNGLAIFSAGYVKRWFEGNLYDRIFDTNIGKKIKGWDKRVRYGMEFGLNLLTAFFDQKLAGDTALKRFVKDVGLDIGPEISKRLINNAKTQEEKELVSVLLQLEDQTLQDLLSSLYDIESTEKAKVLKKISRLSIDEIIKLAKLTPESWKKFLDLLEPPRSSKKFADRATRTLKSLNEQWEKWLEEKRKARGK